jgi:hypothetical protein
MFKHQLLSGAALVVAAISTCVLSAPESHYIVVARQVLLTSVETGE